MEYVEYDNFFTDTEMLSLLSVKRKTREKNIHSNDILSLLGIKIIEITYSPVAKYAGYICL